MCIRDSLYGFTWCQVVSIENAWFIGGEKDLLLAEYAQKNTGNFPHVRNMSPVSYTHLDVYKRQLQSFVCALAGGVLGKKWGAISIGLWLILGMIGLPVLTMGKAGIGIFPVSYTHLDVYKRQAYNIRITYIKGKKHFEYPSK